MCSWCKLFECKCSEVKGQIKGYEVVCDLKCETCPEGEEIENIENQN